MQSKLSTSRDVAKLAGVSQSSVCRVFSGNWDGKISGKTRAKVLAAANTLGYNPNAIARSLTARRSGIIGIALAEGFHDYYNVLLSKLTNLIQAHNMRVMVYQTGLYSDIGTVVNQLLEYRVDGIIITPAAATTHRLDGSASNGNVPVVLVNIYTDNPDYSCVHSEDYDGAAKMADYLCGCGCTDFAVLTPKNSRYQFLEERARGFLDTLKKNGVEKIIVEDTDYPYEAGRAAARSLLSRPTRPNTIFCMGGRMALGVMDTARFEFGLSIPADISIAGYGDLFVPELEAYKLTTLDQQPDLHAQEIVDVLIHQIDNYPCEPQRVQVPMCISARQSVRQARLGT